MKFSLSFLSALILIFLTSCSDPCDDVNCGENGSCDEGICLCDTGYEGVNCEAKEIDKFIGSWTSNDFQCAGDNVGPVTLVIEQGPSITELAMYDLDEPLFRFDITYSGTELTVPEQNIDGTTVSGTGNLNGDDTISFLFQVSEDGDTETCSGIFSK